MKKFTVLISLLVSVVYAGAQTSSACNTGSTSCAITLSVTSGDTLLVFANSNTVSSNIESVTDTESGGLGPIVGLSNIKDSGSTVLDSVFLGSIMTTGSDTITCHVTNNANYLSCLAIDLPGVAFKVDAVAAPQSNSSTTSWITGSLTAAGSSDTLIALFGSNGSGTTFGSFSAGYTATTAETSVPSTAGAYKVASGSGSQSAVAATASGSVSGLGLLIAVGYGAPPPVGTTCETGVFSCAMTLHVSSGDTILLFAHSNSIPATLTASGSLDSAYTPVTGLNGIEDSGSNVLDTVFVAYAASTGSDTITCTTTNEAHYLTCMALDFRGLVTVVDSTSKESNESTTSWTTAGLSTTSSNDILIAFLGTNTNGASFSGWSGGYGVIVSSGTILGFASAYQLASTSGSQSAVTATASTSTTGLGIMVALKFGTPIITRIRHSVRNVL
jgi:hypothetical protein